MESTTTTLPDILSIATALKDVGMTGLLIMIIIGGFRRMWVFGWIYDQRVGEITRDRDEWRQMALGGMDIARRGTKVAQDVLGANERDRR